MKQPKVQHKPGLGLFLMALGAVLVLAVVWSGSALWEDFAHQSRSWGSDTRIIGNVVMSVTGGVAVLIGLPALFAALGLLSGGWVLWRGPQCQKDR